MRGVDGFPKVVLTFVAILALTAGTVMLSYLALTRDTSSVASDPAGDGPSASPSPTASVSASPAVDGTPPEVTEQLQADFAKSAMFPAGARTYDNSATGSPLRVDQGYLSHDPPTGHLAIGSLEVRLPTTVQKLGARVEFAPADGGDVVLVAWTSSLVDAREAGETVPTSGLRLVTSSGSWRLTVYDKGEQVIASNRFDPVTGPQTFELYRAGSQVWVVDPTGFITTVDDKRVNKLEGPWACWQLAESDVGVTPARIYEIWAG